MDGSLRTDILPAQVTIDNIGSWDRQSTNFLNGIQNIDIVNLENGIINIQNEINNLPSYLTTELEKYRYKGSVSDRNALTNMPTGSIFLINTQEIEGENE